MRRILLLSVLTLLLSVRAVDPAAVPVIDVGAIANLAYIMADAAKLVGLEVKDLAVLANVGPMTQMAQHIAVLLQQLENERRLILEIGELWGVLADEGIGICTVEARRDWMYKAVQLNQRRLRGTVTNTLALVEQTGEIVQTLVQMAQLWSVITGSVGGLQVIAGLQASTNAHLATIQTALTSEKMAKASEQVVEMTDALMMDCLAQASMADWGIVGPR
jgi:hypothetical protein